MGHSEANISPRTEISPAVIPNLGEPDLERNPVKVEDVSTATEELHTPQERDVVNNTAKKSLSFKLAFAGLAASLFVFQLDATCLGIALPVSHNTLYSLYPTCIND